MVQTKSWYKIYKLLYNILPMDQSTIIGLIASIIIASTMVPQLIKIRKEKKVEGISNGMLYIIITGLSVWVWYGFLKDDWIIIGSNSFSVMINIITLFYVFKYKKNT